MAEEILLTAEPRQLIGKQVKQMRRSGSIPGVLYGKSLEQPVSLKIDEKELKQVVAKAGRNRLIKLTMDSKTPRLVLARAVQREPITGQILHVDFLQVSMTEKLTTDVPIVLIGTSPAVTRGEGLLIHGIDSVQIRVLPGDLIPHIEIDVSGLENLNQSLFVKDLKVTDKVEILTSAEEMIAKVVPAKEEVIVEEAPVAAAEVEVIKKGKIEEEGAEGEAVPAPTPEAAKKPVEAKKEEKK
jgi:large subunit ribosomal protein L25